MPTFVNSWHIFLQRASLHSLLCTYAWWNKLITEYRTFITFNYNCLTYLRESSGERCVTFLLDSLAIKMKVIFSSNTTWFSVEFRAVYFVDSIIYQGNCFSAIDYYTWVWFCHVSCTRVSIFGDSCVLHPVSTCRHLHCVLLMAEVTFIA